MQPIRVTLQPAANDVHLERTDISAVATVATKGSLKRKADHSVPVGVKPQRAKKKRIIEKRIAPFVSATTLKAMRITIKSMIDLVELLLSKELGYKYVLTGKFNQDCLEVITFLQ